MRVKPPGRGTPHMLSRGPTTPGPTRRRAYSNSSRERLTGLIIRTSLGGLRARHRHSGRGRQLARRFFECHPELFKTTRRDGYTWVYPRRAAFQLARRKHRAKTADCDGATGNAAETGPNFAKDRARAMLSKVSTLGRIPFERTCSGNWGRNWRRWRIRGTSSSGSREAGRNTCAFPIGTASIRRRGCRTFGRRGGVRGDVRGVSTTTGWL